MTILIGIVASLVAGWILAVVFNYSNASGGIPWWSWIGGAILAAIGIAVYGNVAGRRRV